MGIKNEIDDIVCFQIQKPLFYSNEYGIRFEIGNPKFDLMTKKYFKSAMIRIASIYEDVFSNEDELFIVINSIREKIAVDNWKLPKEICSCIMGDSFEYEYEITNNIYDPEDDDYITVKSYLKLKNESLNYMELLRMITRCDMGEYDNVSIQDEVFILNKSKSIVFNYYDDRGADVVSKEKDSLKFLYDRRKEWILDYDKERINKQYVTKSI